MKPEALPEHDDDAPEPTPASVETDTSLPTHSGRSQRRGRSRRRRAWPSGVRVVVRWRRAPRRSPALALDEPRPDELPEPQVPDTGASTADAETSPPLGGRVTVASSPPAESVEPPAPLPTPEPEDTTTPEPPVGAAPALEAAPPEDAPTVAEVAAPPTARVKRVERVEMTDVIDLVAPAETASDPDVTSDATPWRARLGRAALMLLPGVATVLALPLASPVLAAAAAVAHRVLRPRTDGRRLAIALTTSSLALATLALGLASLAPRFSTLTELPALVGPSWSLRALALGGLVGAAAVSALGWLLPHRRLARALGAPAALLLVLGLAWFVARPLGLLLVTGGLALATAAGLRRLAGRRHRAQVPALSALALAGALVVTSGSLGSLVGLTVEHVVSPLLASLLTAVAALVLRRDDGRPDFLGLAALAVLGTSLVGLAVILGFGGAPALALALVPAATWQLIDAQSRRAFWSDADSQATTGRSSPLHFGLAAAPLLGLGAVLLDAGSSLQLGLAVIAALVAVLLAGERALGGGLHFTIAAGLGLLLSGLAAAAAAGLPGPVLPSVAALVALGLLLAGDRLPGRTRRADWEPPMLGLALVIGLSSGIVFALGHAPAAWSGLGLACLLTATLCRPQREARLVLPWLLSATALSLGLGLGRPELLVPWLAVSALVTWAWGRWAPELRWPALAHVGLAIVGVLVAALTEHVLVAAAGLALLALLGAWELLHPARPRRPETAAATLLVGAGSLALLLPAARELGPWLGSGLLGSAVVAQAGARWLRDARLARELRRLALLVTWGGLVATVLAPLSLQLIAWQLVGVSVALLLVSALRRVTWPALLAALCTVAAGGLLAVVAGLPVSLWPLAFLLPGACWLLAWSLLSQWQAGRTGPWLLVGAWLAWTAVFLSAWQPAIPVGARVAAVALGLGALAGGLLLRKAELTLLGAGCLLAELLLLSAQALGTADAPRETLPLVVLAVAVLAVVGAWRRTGWSLREWLRATEESGDMGLPEDSAGPLTTS
ncbi:MAG: hypothetical protein AAF533_26445 [Acidobacteriota bacterium]